MTTRTYRKCHLSTLELHELDEACHPIREGFGGFPPYLVGSVNKRASFRDVDVRLLLEDVEYDALFAERPALWALLSRVLGTYLRNRTGLPIDFQIQRLTEANEKFKEPRNPLGMRTLRQYAGGGDGTPALEPKRE